MAAIQSALRRATAEIYVEAVSAGWNMRAVTNAIETIREVLERETDVFVVWRTFDDQVALADSHSLKPALVNLRARFERAAISQEVQRINLAFDRNPQEGWNVWLQSYVNSFTKWGWRGSFGRAIADEALPVAPTPEWPVERIRECTRLVSHGRWPETYDWFIFLSEQGLPANQRARMIVIAAEIHLYHFFQPSKCEALLMRARELAPDEARTWTGWGEYLMQQKRLDEAKRCFERVVQAVPDSSEGFVGLGDCFDQAGDLSSAQSQYEQAITNAPGTTDGYRRLMNWHGRASWFKDRQDQIASYFEHVLALSDDPYSVWLDLGLIYKQNREFKRARECIARALDLDGSYSSAHTWLGYTYLDEVDQAGTDASVIVELYNLAQPSFERVIQIAPRALDGYWAMSGLFMKKREWPAALEYCDRGLTCHPEWESIVRVRRAEILRELGRFDQAEQELMRSLELEPDNPAAVNALSTLADAYDVHTGRDTALRVLETLRRLKGNAYEHTYRNRIGNLFYFYNEHPAAAEQYRLAISASPTLDVLHSNLALALENVHVPGRRLVELDEAIIALRRARELNPESKPYEDRLKLLESERRFVLTYGENALKFEVGVVPLRVEVSDEVLPDVLRADKTELSDQMLTGISAVRDGIRATFGVTIPFVSFRVLEGTSLFPGEFRISLMEDAVHQGHVEPGSRFIVQLSNVETAPSHSVSEPEGFWVRAEGDATREPGSSEWTVAEFILYEIQRVLVEHLADLLGYDGAVSLLDASKAEACAAIRKSPEELTRLVRVLKGMLQRAVPIVEAERICVEFVRLRTTGSSVEEVVDQLSSILASVTSSSGRTKATA